MPWQTALLLLLTAADPTPDLRVALVEKQLERDLPATLALVDGALESDRDAANAMGLPYLRGQLLMLAGRRGEALNAFAETMATSPELAPYGRYRLAVAQEKSGAPEVAAGLIATLLGENPPRALISPSIALLEKTIAAGGDCRLLSGLRRLRLPSGDRRRLDFAFTHCARRHGEPHEEERGLRALLEEDASDDVALHAAHRLAEILDLSVASPESLVAIGMAFYEHREFEDAVRHLSQAVVRSPKDAASIHRLFDTRYALARSYFWLRRWDAAARSFALLARDTREPGRQAQALYQRARCFELAGESSWPEAALAFEAARDVEPNGRWAAASVVALLRLAWLRGDEASGLAALEALRRERKLTQVSGALLFLASSDLVQGRGDRAGAWLDEARRLRRLPTLEIDYWQGRQREIEGNAQGAVDTYLDVMHADLFHPFARAAAHRLEAPALLETARSTAKQLAASSDPEKLYRAWLLLGDGDALGRRAAQRLDQILARDPRAAAYLDLKVTPVDRWPLWQARLTSADDKLLALGLFDEASSRVLRYFPVTEPALAFTGSLVLSQFGSTKRSLYITEILAKRLPDEVPIERLPIAYRQLLYPFRYSYLILRESSKREIDSYLLAAIIREESRYDPDAFSGASARGLTQFILPTARQIAASLELGPIEAADLQNPEIAVALGAGYLRQLFDHFGGATERVVAAYNAGEPQAELWRNYCLSDEPEEFLTKVAFRETNNYVRKVLTSRANYLDLYFPRPKVVPAEE